jgi:hypothetical protein
MALILGLCPARWFTPRGFEEDDGGTWIVEGTARIEHV